MRFSIEDAVLERFPGMRVVGVVASGLDNRDPDGRVAAEWDADWRRAGALAGDYANAQSHPNVAAWREALRRVGVSHKDHPSSIEALLRRAMKGGDPVRINPAVDLLNAVSLRWVVPAGGWDLGEVEGDLALRMTVDGDTFRSLDADEPEALPPGEVAYADGAVVLTRHFVWRQAREALVLPRTTDAILLSEVLAGLGDDLADRVLDDLGSRVRSLLGADVAPFSLDAGRTSFEW
ncbi:MAG TPA: phenylalanine--tRNA ligase beta subunit-related protein [Acidimicrobiales bacterium]